MGDSHMAMLMMCISCGHRYCAVSPVPCAAESECPACHEFKCQQQPELTDAVSAAISFRKGNTVLLRALMEMVSHSSGSEKIAREALARAGMVMDGGLLDWHQLFEREREEGGDDGR